MVSGSQRTPLIGVHMPPEDETTLEHLETALFRFQGGPTPITLGDLNTELRAPRNGWEQRIADMLADAGVFNMPPPLHAQAEARQSCDMETTRQGRGGIVPGTVQLHPGFGHALVQVGDPERTPQLHQ